MRDRELLTIDVFAVVAELGERLPALVDRSHGKRIQDYDTSAYERGLDGLGSTTSLLDLTALGRQEEWEEPQGRASALGTPVGSERIRYHDEYDE